MSSNLQDDIAYMKALAEAGNAGPLRSGYTLMWAGILFGLASVGQYLLMIGVLPQQVWVSFLIWFGLGGLFGLLAFLRNRQCRAVTTTGRASSSVWTAVSLGIGAFIFTVILVSYQTRQTYVLSFISPVLIVLYGMGWWVDARMSGLAWLKWVSVGCFVAAPVLGLMAAMPEQMLAYTACLLLLATLPGYILMKAEKA
ncbi:hypothetical protein ABAC460_06295 [Asticcacaulis sp. AC460]|uniref:hypothetical protein n=1 Tax=Asticcacaulis sp. AC460 TaxID=1282360 RepID=UPI0003C3DB96|nr:hypothetical protein [Asticcacaulis sp. AC460]ESQ91168.1 hypothetical protein ABAC460_06295 [Asticcacaulis sp. AC460]